MPLEKHTDRLELIEGEISTSHFLWRLRSPFGPNHWGRRGGSIRGDFGLNHFENKGGKQGKYAFWPSVETELTLWLEMVVAYSLVIVTMSYSVCFEQSRHVTPS